MSAIPVQATLPVYPRMSARHAAHFLRMPSKEQAKYLRALKYPKQSPQAFMRPYYGPAISGIRSIYDRGFRGLVDSRAKLEGLKEGPRRNHLLRVFNAFVESAHAGRRLKVVKNHRYAAFVHGLELRLSPHLVALDGNETRYLYFNEKAIQLDPEEARLTLEFAYWILVQSGLDVKPHQFEMIDLFGGAYYVGQEPRSATIETLEEMARIIKSLWPTI